jgi:hypothetical protein
LPKARSVTLDETTIILALLRKLCSAGRRSAYGRTYPARAASISDTTLPLRRSFLFKETEMRKMCRNPIRCFKRAVPVSNEREAFCCKGCYSSIYLHRCRVCEGSIEQKRDGRRMLCKKAARRCGRLPPSATAACKKKRKAMSCLTSSRMDPRNSASAGLCAA